MAALNLMAAAAAAARDVCPLSAGRRAVGLVMVLRRRSRQSPCCERRGRRLPREVTVGAGAVAQIKRGPQLRQVAIRTVSLPAARSTTPSAAQVPLAVRRERV